MEGGVLGFNWGRSARLASQETLAAHEFAG